MLLREISLESRLAQRHVNLFIGFGSKTQGRIVIGRYRFGGRADTIPYNLDI